MGKKGQPFGLLDFTLVAVTPPLQKANPTVGPIRNIRGSTRQSQRIQPESQQIKRNYEKHRTTSRSEREGRRFKPEEKRQGLVPHPLTSILRTSKAINHFHSFAEAHCDKLNHIFSEINSKRKLESGKVTQAQFSERKLKPRTNTPHKLEFSGGVH